MKRAERMSFADLREFRDYARDYARLVYYYIYRGTPDPSMIEALTGCVDDEALILLDIEEDRGFLASTDATVEITPDRDFIAKKMADRPGLGAWFKGTSLDFATLPDEVKGLIEYARRFALPADHAAMLTHADSKSRS